MRPYPTWRTYRSDAKRMAAVIAACFGVGVFLWLMPIPLEEPMKLPNGALAEGGPEVGRMFQAFARAGTRVVIGTSETGNSMGTDSYYELMDAHLRSEGRGRVVTYGGAGRSPVVWFPLMTVYGDAMRGLKVVYYVNPVYWSDSLNTFNDAYFARYVSKRFVGFASEGLRTAGLTELIPHESLARRTKRREQWLTRLAWPFFVLRAPFIYDVRAITKSHFARADRNSHPSAPTPGWPLTAETANDPGIEVDTTTGVSESNFERRIQMRRNVTWGGFKTRELDAFIAHTGKLGIDLCLVIGPYNRTLATLENPRLNEEYERWHREIRKFLELRGVKFVDAFGVSWDARSHVDALHIGRAGARGIYQAWKDSTCDD